MACLNSSAIRFNEEEKQLFLVLHNDYRNAVCNGSMGFNKCLRTPKMVSFFLFGKIQIHIFHLQEMVLIFFA